MKLSLFSVTLWALSLASCQSPVTNPQTVTSSSSSLPLGQGSGVTVYAATADGNGLLYYAGTTTTWKAADWSSYYNSSSPYSSSMTYPPVSDVTVSSGTIYAATAAGLLVGSRSSWARYQPGLTLTGVTVSGTNVFVSGPVQTTSGFYGLGLLSTSNLSTAPTALINAAKAASATQWAPWGTGAAAATSLGLYYSSSPTTAGSYAPATTSSGTSLNAGTVNTVYAPASTLYVGTALGYSTTTSSSTFNWTNSTGPGNVTGILSTTVNSTPTLFLTTTSGLAYTQNGSSTWSTLISGVGANNIVRGATTATYYYANGSGGLGILQIDSSGNITQSSVLTWANIAKVFVTIP